MTQREFERRVKGTSEQTRRRVRRERSQPGRSGALPRAVFATVCVVVVLGLTAGGIHDFSFKRGDSPPTVQQSLQLTQQMPAAQAAAPHATLASAAHEVPHPVHLQRVAARAHRSARHSGAAGAPRNSSAAPLAGAPDHEAGSGGGVEFGAADDGPDGAAARMGAAVIWTKSRIRAWCAPLVGANAADSAADSFGANFPMVVAAGSFILVMLLCLGAALAMSGKGSRTQRAEA
jgi:hypothetical protein